MKKVIHQFVLAVVSLSFVWVSLSWFTDVQAYIVDDQKDILLTLDTGVTASFQKANQDIWQDVSSSRIVQVGDVLLSKDLPGVRVTFPGGGELRLAENTSIQLFQNETDDGGYHVALQSGEVWVTSQGALHSISVYVAGGTVVSSRDGTCDVSYKDGEVNVYAAKNPVRLGFYMPLAKLVSTPSILNSILITEGNRLTVTLSKIQPKLEKLLYSKLIKEFQYGPLSLDSLNKNTWFQRNIAGDALRRDNLLNHITQIIKDRGLSIPDPESTFAGLMDRVHDVRFLLTFDPRKKDLRIANDALVHLDDALYYYATSQQDKGDVRMQLFKARLQTMNDNKQLISYISDELWNRFQAYAIFVPQDGSLFRIRTELRETLLSLRSYGHNLPYVQASQLVRSYLYDVYQSLHFDNSMSRDLLSTYFSAFHKIFSGYSADIVKNPSVLAEENQIITQLYLKDPIFYQETYFQNAFDLQSQWLSLLPEGRDKNEENQTLVASKIELMKRLRLFFFDEKIEVKDASPVLFRLLSDISSALPDTETAVAQYFKKNLDDQEDFWRYLNSSDFSESKLYGQTHKDRFSAFLKNKQDLGEIDKIQKGLLGTLPPASAESKQTLADIQKAFTGYGVKNLKLAPLLDKDQGQVFIESADYNGIPFSAIYDRDRNLISDIKVYNDTILSASVPLDRIKNIFVVKSQQQDQTPLTDSTVDTSSNDRVEKVAQLFLLKKLQEFSFSLDPAQITTIDYAKKLFQVRGAKLPFDKSQISVDFTVDLMKNSISSIQVTVLTSKQSMPGEFSFDKVVSAIQKYYDQEFYKTLPVAP
ncbi:hypothetical protein KAZ92_00025 [Candidatus Gracilibacteria bacterium]|nr:hypothetical protein [Candidatus Gracilibacteria bacterium]